MWRRIQIPAAATTADLHEVLQEALGWTNSHLHEFGVGAERFGVPDLEWGDEDDVRDEAGVSVGEVAAVGAKLSYVYDFGDNWRHDLTVEQIVVAEAGVRYPRCLDGARACPPEDVGGPGGYETFLAALRDPDHDNHERYIQWGAGFDPTGFGPAETDQALARLAWEERRTRPEAGCRQGVPGACGHAPRAAARRRRRRDPAYADHPALHRQGAQGSAGPPSRPARRSTLTGRLVRQPALDEGRKCLLWGRSARSRAAPAAGRAGSCPDRGCAPGSAPSPLRSRSCRS